MDALTLSALVNAGYAKGAAVAGLACQQFRAGSSGSPFGTALGSVQAAFDQDPSFKLVKPWNRTKGEGYALADTSNLAPGDYLVYIQQQQLTLNGEQIAIRGETVTIGGSGTSTLSVGGQPVSVGGIAVTVPGGATVSGTSLPDLAADVYFVERLEAFRPAEVVFCNVVLTFSRPQEQASPGAGNYGGRTQASDAVLATGWPASLLIKGRGENPPSKLPIDVRAGAFEVLVPAILGVSLLSGDRITDATGTAYVIYTVEVSSYGNRLMAAVATT